MRRIFARSVWAVALLFPLAAFAAADAPVAVPVPTPAVIAFNHQLAIFWIVGQALALVIPLIFLFTGLGAGLRTLCRRVAGGRRYWTVTLFAGFYLILATALMLPFQYERHFVLPHAFALTHDSLAEWYASQGVDLATKLVAVFALAWLPYWILKRSPRYWWLWTSAAIVPIVLVILMILPIWVEPLTTSFKPLADSGLKAELSQLAARCGVADIPILVGGGDDTVVGLGPTRRIYIGSGTMKRESHDQILFTIGHELKHYVEGDTWKAFALICALLFVGFFLTDRLGRAAIARWHRRLGFDDLADPASLPLFVFSINLLMFAIVVPFNMLDRHIEHEGDRFGLELTHQNHAAAELFASWTKTDLELPDPAPLQYIFMMGHPSDGERIRFANTYRPWAEGKPLVYAKDCRAAEGK
jgi:STE24 endopeptidase